MDACALSTGRALFSLLLSPPWPALFFLVLLSSLRVALPHAVTLSRETLGIPRDIVLIPVGGGKDMGLLCVCINVPLRRNV